MLKKTWEWGVWREEGKLAHVQNQKKITKTCFLKHFLQISHIQQKKTKLYKKAQGGVFGGRRGGSRPVNKPFTCYLKK